MSAASERLPLAAQSLDQTRQGLGSTSGDTTPTAGELQSPIDGKQSTAKKLLGLVKKKDTTADKTAHSGSVTGTSLPAQDSAGAHTSNTMTSPTSGQAGLEQPPAQSPSPHLPSAASSLIFERNVQESTLSLDAAPAIPAHIKTEDQIPPALEASSLAITDSHLGPDEVEIVTHAAHQPAAATIAESIPSARPSELNLPLSPQDSHANVSYPTSAEADDTASNYGALDPNDVRRLSFISFADVVHAEHAESGAAASLQHLPLASATSEAASHSATQNRPVSPARSPLSVYSQPFSPDVTTPPTTASGPGSTKDMELSPVRSQAASPPIGSPHQHGELSIETLSQTLRKTASRDLSGFNRSPPTSAI